MPYETKYIVKTKLRDLLIEDDTKIRIAADAKDLMYEYFEDALKNAAKKLVDGMPRKSKGKEKGKLKRITLTPDDFKKQVEAVEQVEA